MIDKVILYILIAIIPGLIWLFIFLRRDNLEEPKLEITKVFYLSMLLVIPAGLIEMNLLEKISSLEINNLYYFLKFVVIVGLIEEIMKYLVVRYAVLKRSFLDEPIDIVIYMIVSGLGFATAENILTFIADPNLMTDPQISNGVKIAMVRFFGANLLHILCSGIIGIFIALSFYQIKKRYLILVLGFTLSIIIHGVFNFSIELFIINNDEQIAMAPFVITSTILLPFILAIGKIRKMKSVCKIN
ncbi:MAG: Protease PrsW [Parcubacteria group bacterium ADurb.Bin216]|nr:MAG: Protease PrsW [Parcubacteria group bacterium ADurb.Bin216]